MYESVGVHPYFEKSLEVGHAFPTLGFGNDCREASLAPYISNCRRDIAGEILNNILGPLKARSVAKQANLFRFSQAQMGGIPNPASISMAQFGYVYVPAACRAGGKADCRVHLSFHGCRQTTDVIGDLYFTKTGYNEWAESNYLIVVYPQAMRWPALSNPRGCWDWWGYTGPGFYTKTAPQIAVVSRIARAFMRGQGKLLPYAVTKPQE
jgi:hypothetical protein